MLAVLSPAKKLDTETPLPSDVHSQPRLIKQAAQLARAARKLKSQDLKNLMGISDDLADLNVARFKAFDPDFDLSNARQAMYLFNGDVYQGLDAYSLEGDALDYAQDHLRILSGLYGVLRPLDLAQPYRLEMGIRFKTTKADDLYGYWGETIAKQLAGDLDDGVLVNLASNEYFKAVKPKALKARIITPTFKEMREGQPRQISFFAKKARGLMARYMIDQRLSDADGLKDFDSDGYGFRADLSKGDTWVFTRPDSRG